MKSLLAAAALMLAATPAFAQSAPPPALATFASSAEVQALIAKAKAAPAAPMVALPILSLAPYQATLEYRTGAPSPAATHDLDVELMVVLEGSGTLMLGGVLVNPKPGASAGTLQSPEFTGAKPRPFAKGDFAVIPKSEVHQLIPAAGQPLILMTFKAPAK